VENSKSVAEPQQQLETRREGKRGEAQWGGAGANVEYVRSLEAVVGVLSGDHSVVADARDG
jgi:hypothetical protein